MGSSVIRPEATLVDLLDRVLDRGLVIHADIMITLAGIPPCRTQPARPAGRHGDDDG